MEHRVYSPLELDAIGEIINISLGSSATAISSMLDHRVNISTPNVTPMAIEKFNVMDVNSVLGIEIKYVSGITGNNIMLLKKQDVRVIVDILMGSETQDDDFELNDFSISAACEVMNQMMGAASTALSDFLGKPVNISTPEPFMVDDIEQFKTEHITPNSGKGTVVVVKFTMDVEDKLSSEFVNIMPVELADELLAGFGFDAEPVFGDINDMEAAISENAAEQEPKTGEEAAELLQDIEKEAQQKSVKDIELKQPEAPPPEYLGSTEPQVQQEAPPQGAHTAPPQNAYGAPLQGAYGAPPGEYGAPPQGAYGAPPQMPPQGAYGMPQQNIMPQGAYGAPVGGGYGVPPQHASNVMYQGDPKVINAQRAELPTLNQGDRLTAEQAQNLDLIMSVPLQISVEIGRTKRKVEDILTFTKGSLVVLDKLAGDQVDLYVNGLCIAKGDVVVINDSFGVRITEVLKQSQLLEIAGQK